MQLIGFIHKLRWFSEPDAKNGAGSPCATAHAGHYLCLEVVPTTVTTTQRKIARDIDQGAATWFLDFKSSKTRDYPRDNTWIQLRASQQSLKPTHGFGINLGQATSCPSRRNIWHSIRIGNPIEIARYPLQLMASGNIESRVSQINSGNFPLDLKVACRSIVAFYYVYENDLASVAI